MSFKEWVIGGIIAIAALIGSMLAPAVIESQVFKAYPEFKADYISNIENNTQKESVLLKNIGKIQAKNVNMFIQSNDKISIKKIDCPEVTITDFIEGETLDLKFAKFSTNIDCYLDFESSIEGSIYRVVVSSDDAPGYQHVFKKDDKKDGVLAVFPSFITWQVGLIFFASVTYAIVGIGLTYFVFRIQKRNRLRKTTHARLNEIQNNIENLKNERKVLEESTRDIKPSEMPKHWGERLVWIENELNKLSSEKDQLTGIISTDMDLHSMVGKFFTNWAIFEQQLHILISKFEDKEVPRFQIRDMLTILHRREIMTREQLADFERVRQFRNELAHGIIRPSKKELDIMNTKLEKLLSVISDHNNKNNSNNTN